MQTQTKTRKTIAPRTARATTKAKATTQPPVKTEDDFILVDLEPELYAEVQAHLAEAKGAGLYPESTTIDDWCAAVLRKSFQEWRDAHAGQEVACE